MQTEVFTVNDPIESAEILQKAAAIIQNGGLVVFPTETVYGLGADATNEAAAKSIYTAKGRPSDNPLIIHIADPADAEPYAVTNPTYYKIAAQFMPGPITVILQKKESIPYSVTGGLDTVAVRCPSHPVARALIRSAGVPIAAPSANRSGRPSPTTAAHTIEDLAGRVDMILDGGDCDFGIESTIIKIDGAKATLLRPGAVTLDALCCVLDHVTVAPAVTAMLGEGERPLSPGMKYKHYAPRASLVLLNGDRSDVLAFLKNEIKDPSVGVLCFDEEKSALSGCTHLFPIGAENDQKTHAHCLFAALRAADTFPEIRKLYAHLPSQEGIGLALYNRCIRAAAHTILNLSPKGES